MAAEKTKRAARQSGRKAGANDDGLIWHIIGWETDFEPDDAMRRRQKSALRYVKLHIEGLGELDKQQLQLRRRMLLSRKGGDSAWAVFTLCCIAVGDRGEGRGCVWNHKGEPADASEIAVLIGLTKAQVERALPLLEGEFMERITVPKHGRFYTAPSATSRSDENGEAIGTPIAPYGQPSAAGGPPPAVGGPSSAGGGPSSAAGGPPSAPCGPRSAKGGVTTNREQGTRNREQEPGTPTVGGGGPSTGCGQLENRGTSEGVGVGVGGCWGEGVDGLPVGNGQTANGEAATGDGDRNGERSPPRQTPPAQQLSDELTPPDTGQGLPGGLQGPGGPPGSDCPHEPQLRPGRLLKGGQEAAWGDAGRVAQAVFVRLHPSREAVVVASRKGGTDGTAIPPDEYQRRQLRCYEVVWRRVLDVGLDDRVVGQLYGKAMKQALTLARPKTPLRKSPGAAWVDWVNKHCPRLAATRGEGRADDG